MPEQSHASPAPGSDEKTEVLPETAVQLVEMERLRTELAAAEERAKNHWDQYMRALAEVDNVPAVRPEAPADVVAVGQRRRAVDRDAVVVVHLHVVRAPQGHGADPVRLHR